MEEEKKDLGGGEGLYRRERNSSREEMWKKTDFLHEVDEFCVVSWPIHLADESFASQDALITSLSLALCAFSESFSLNRFTSRVNGT